MDRAALVDAFLHDFPVLQRYEYVLHTHCTYALASLGAVEEGLEVASLTLLMLLVPSLMLVKLMVLDS